jgi:hypothetical protein
VRLITHGKNDIASLRMFGRQLIVPGSATIGQVQRAFGVPLVSIKRATKLYRAPGATGFFAPQPRRAGRTPTPGKLDDACALPAVGEPVARIGRLLEVMPDTIRRPSQRAACHGSQKMPAVAAAR